MAHFKIFIIKSTYLELGSPQGVIQYNVYKQHPSLPNKLHVDPAQK